jgi:hypothetical protein
MSGVNFNATTFSARLAEIESALKNPKSNKIVNDRAQLVNKENGFVRFLKIMVLPLARFFGADPFCHTRANKVATTLVSQYQKLEKELSAEDKNRLSRIITKLDDKTNHRYGKLMQVFKSIIPVDPSVQVSGSATADDPMPMSKAKAPPKPPVFPKMKQATEEPGKTAPQGGSISPEALAEAIKLKKEKAEAKKQQEAEGGKEAEGRKAEPDNKPSATEGETKALEKKDSKKPMGASPLVDALAKAISGNAGKINLKHVNVEDKKADASSATEEEKDAWAVFGAKKNNSSTIETVV